MDAHGGVVWKDNLQEVDCEHQHGIEESSLKREVMSPKPSQEEATLARSAALEATPIRVLGRPAYVCMRNANDEESSVKREVMSPKPSQEAQPALTPSGALAGAARSSCKSSSIARLLNEVVGKSVEEFLFSANVADPSLQDCPLLGGSEGFRALTGYALSEIVGKNCLFLSETAIVDPSVLEALRRSIDFGTEFIGVLPNIRKDGALFLNLAHMRTVPILGHPYVISIQADVTNSSIDSGFAGHSNEIQMVVEQIHSKLHQMNILSGLTPLVLNQLPVLCPVKAVDPTAQLLQLPLSDGVDKVTNGCRSVGSALHPHACVECMHFVFGKAGCRDGANCNYCHEFHPRKNPKKNRRHMRRFETQPEMLTNTVPEELPGGNAELALVKDPVLLAGSGMLSDDASSPDAASPKEATLLPDMTTVAANVLNVALANNTGANAHVPELLEAGENDDLGATGLEPLANTTSDRSLSPLCDHNPMTCMDAAEGFPRPGSCSSVTLSYGEPGAHEDSHPSHPCDIVLILGQKVRLAANLSVAQGKQSAAEPALNFAVKPPLPQGLSLDSSTGAIIGQPCEVQKGSLHTIVVKAEATGPWGLRLGYLQLAVCELSVSVVDLSRFRLKWACEDLVEGCSMNIQGRPKAFIAHFTAA